MSLAVWSDDRTGHHAVYGALLEKTGRPITPQGGFLIAGRAGVHQGDPRVAACGNVFLVVWGNGHDDASTTDLFATRVLDTGVILDPTPIVVSDQPGVQHNFRTPASDGQDTFLVAFRTAADSVFGGINTMRTSASDGLTPDPDGGRVLAFGGPGGGLKKNPSVVFGQGRFLVLWDDGRDGCAFPGEAGCLDVYGAFVGPDTGETDPSGLVGGIRVATDPPGYPDSVQGAVGVASDAYTDSFLVTYRDTAIGDAPMALRMKRIRTDGAILDQRPSSDPGVLIDRGRPSTGVFMRADPVALDDAGVYLIAYTMDDQVLVRTVYFEDRLMPTVRYNPFATSRVGGIAVGLSGRVYVSDYGRGRVAVHEEYAQPAFAIDGAGLFSDIRGIAVDANENIYLADAGNHRILVFDATGQLLSQFGSRGAADGQFNRPHGIAVDASGRIVVTDYGNHRIQVFDATGGFVGKFGMAGAHGGGLLEPTGVAADCSGNMLVTDRFTRISEFDPDGLFYRGLVQDREYSSIAVAQSGVYFASSWPPGQCVVARFIPLGNHVIRRPLPISRWDYQHGVALDRMGRLYVTETNGVVTRYEYTVW